MQSTQGSSQQTERHSSVLSDEEIIQLYIDRDERAIEETQKKYGRYCAKTAMNFLDDLRDVDECLEDTWIKAWYAIPRDRPKILRLYLGHIASNSALDRFRKNKSAKRGGGAEEVDIDAFSETLISRQDVEEEILKMELYHLVFAFLQTQGPRARMIFYRRFILGESVQELSKECGVSENYISVITARERKRFAKYLQKHWDKNFVR